MSATHVFAGIPGADRDAAVSWYTRLFGAAPALLPNDSEAAWRVTDQGWVYVIADPPRAGSALHTLLVDDLDAFLSGLTARGVETEPIQTLAGSVRRTSITDPDGNVLNIGEPLG
jgi:predicted enzyme related to lactoylglutathione lyase